MAGVSAGQRIRFTVAGSTGEWAPRTTDDVRSQAIAILSQYGVMNTLTITKLSSRLPVVDLWDWRYTADGVLTTKYAHNSIEDVRSILFSAFWNAAGEQPTIALPDYGEIQGPGVNDDTGVSVNKLLGVSSFTIIAAIAVAVFVLKRG